MTAALQLDLLGESVPDPYRDSLLALIAGDPMLVRDRAAVLDAIRGAVRPDGTVSANAWRPLLPPWVAPQCVGAVTHALVKARVLTPTGEYERSTDKKSRNGNKVTPRYRWRETPCAATGTETRP